MKIITGKYKGRKIDGFTLPGTRPTMDRVKESLFAMIQNNISESIVLDLFSGSGNLGIEALSEGAKEAFLVDNNYHAIQMIKKNMKELNISNATFLYMDYQKALDYFKNNKNTFDLIFLDPPYQTNYIEKSINLIEKNELLNNDGIIICESDSLEKIKYSNVWKNVKEKKYGDKYIVLLQKI